MDASFSNGAFREGDRIGRLLSGYFGCCERQSCKTLRMFCSNPPDDFVRRIFRAAPLRACDCGIPREINLSGPPGCIIFVPASGCGVRSGVTSFRISFLPLKLDLI